jgi:exodeoxyribonuclease VII large subunit
MAADVRAVTPSNAAQIIVPDRHEIIRSVRLRVQSLAPRMLTAIDQTRQQLAGQLLVAVDSAQRQLAQQQERLVQTRRLLAEFDPARVLERGYALVRGKMSVGSDIDIETARAIIKARIEHYDEK